MAITTTKTEENTSYSKITHFQNRQHKNATKNQEKKNGILINGIVTNCFQFTFRLIFVHVFLLVGMLSVSHCYCFDAITLIKS